MQGQSLTDWELVVVDDASSDDTHSFLESLEDPRVRFARLEERAERSVARNCGLELAVAPAVLFLDDDDELYPSALELLTGALAGHGSAVAGIGASVNEASGGRRRPSFPKRRRQLDIHLELLAGWVALGGQSLIRTEALKEVGGWRPDLSVAEDQELWLRLCPRGPVAIVPDSVLLHRPHGLEGDAPGHRDIERGVVHDHLRTLSRPSSRPRRAVEAREHLRDAHVAFQTGAYRAALASTVRGIITAPFLLTSPLVGPGLARGLLNATITSLLPRGVANRLRASVTRRRASAST